MEQFEQRLKERLESLSERLGQWKGRANEADTKRILIEPLLSDLGWDIHDPDKITAEYSTAGGRVDYALRVAGKVAVFVEAKALDAGLGESDARQLVGYGASAGVRWGLLTNGAEYALYDNFNTGALPDKLVLRAGIDQLAGGDEATACARLARKFSLLSKEAIESGDIIDRAAGIRAEEQREEQVGRPGGSPVHATVETSEEEEVWLTVRTSFRHLEDLYAALRSKIAERMPHLSAQLETGGEGWIKFRNLSLPPQGRRRDCYFHLTLKKTKVRIEIWYPGGGFVPAKEAVEAKGLESAMHRRSGKGFYITKPEQIDDTLMDWLEAAS
jgi:predicted type IV restriction endonuclease